MKKLIVRKFGGACFQYLDGYRRVAHALSLSRDAQAVVVSARKGMTDRLLGQVSELDGVGCTYADQLVATGELQSAALLLVALHAAGVPAELVPADRVFETDGVAGGARVTAVRTDTVRAVLDRGAIPVVPGFYGAGASGRVVVFRRGGSDYSAVALGAALGAAHVELCKAEVDGIFDKDPNVYPDARKFDTLSHGHALDIARSGGKVLQVDSAELAMREGIVLCVKPAFDVGPGTWVGRGAQPVARARSHHDAAVAA
ncbi:MAG: hypothetical protein AAGC55_03885 [Myxococcota bacterium]